MIKIKGKKKDIERFEKNLYIPIRVRRRLSPDITLVNKLEFILEEVQRITGHKGIPFSFTVHICKNNKETKAYWSNKDKTVFFASNDIQLEYVGHEFAHAVKDLYQVTDIAPEEEHEIVAMYVAEHLFDE